MPPEIHKCPPGPGAWSPGPSEGHPGIQIGHMVASPAGSDSLAVGGLYATAWGLSRQAMVTRDEARRGTRYGIGTRVRKTLPVDGGPSDGYHSECQIIRYSGSMPAREEFQWGSW